MATDQIYIENNTTKTTSILVQPKPTTTATEGAIFVSDGTGDAPIANSLYLAPPGGGSSLIIRAENTIATYTSNEAITETSGLVLLDSGPNSMTLADPSIADNGKRLTIMSIFSASHTVQNGPGGSGFNGRGPTFDTAVFSGGIVGDNINLIAAGGIWYVISSEGVSFN